MAAGPPPPPTLFVQNSTTIFPYHTTLQGMRPPAFGQQGKRQQRKLFECLLDCLNFHHMTSDHALLCLTWLNHLAVALRIVSTCSFLLLKNLAYSAHPVAPLSP